VKLLQQNIQKHAHYKCVMNHSNKRVSNRLKVVFGFKWFYFVTRMLLHLWLPNTKFRHHFLL